ncbi:SPARC-related modular calcium-binding protein 2-like isoform X3 [Macrobrachium nipponense]|uniref:SPARC-related modular calcium-binding protein 2-like isoform X3 n=1 Tax=Macrobrachium nipponense TaxID=159736 RepID=UPI0030C88B95
MMPGSKVMTVMVVWFITSTAARLGLNEEQRLHKRSRHFLESQIQKTREDLLRTVDCNTDCQSRSSEPVCGTNGQTYDSICDLERDICKKGNVKLKHKGECTLAEKCEGNRAFQLEQVASGKLVHVPTCLPDGSYAPVQCHNFTLFCWCSTVNGQIISETITKNKMPQCLGNRTSAPPPEPPQQGKSEGKRRENIEARTTLLSLSVATSVPGDARQPPTAHQPSLGSNRCRGKKRNLFFGNMLKLIMKDYRLQASGERGSQVEAIKWKWAQLDRDDDGVLKRREYRDFRKIVKKFVEPKKCSKVFPRICDANQDKKLTQDEWRICFTQTQRIDRTGKKNFLTAVPSVPGKKCQKARGCGRKPESKRPKPSCDREREMLLQDANMENNSIPILECQANGNYKPIQCHKGYCFCVDEFTGNSLEGTTVTNGTPDCSKPYPHANDWPGCVGKNKTRFMQDLKKYLLNKVDSDGSSPTADASSQQSVEEFAAKYHFSHLDKNGNGYLERREKKELKKFLKRNPKLKICGKKLAKYCDVDSDQRVSLDEWVACVILPTQNGTRNGDDKRPHPFEEILKPET